MLKNQKVTGSVLHCHTDTIYNGDTIFELNSFVLEVTYSLIHSVESCGSLTGRNGVTESALYLLEASSSTMSFPCSQF